MNTETDFDFAGALVGVLVMALHKNGVLNSAEFIACLDANRDAAAASGRTALAARLRTYSERLAEVISEIPPFG